MAEDMKKFLLTYFKQRHFNNMSPEVRAQYDIFRERGDFIGNMKNWNKELIDETTGKNKDVPELTEAEDLEKLYNLFQNVLQDMATNKDDFKYETVSKDFINEWFGGPKPLFDYTKATKDAEQDLEKVRSVIASHKSQVSTLLKDYFSEDFTIDDLINGLDAKDKKYNSDPKFRERMLAVIRYIQTYQNYEEYWPQDAKIEFVQPDTEQWFASDLFDVKRFKDAYPKMLDALLGSKKLRDRFANYGSKKTISKQLTQAISETDYENKDSDDFVQAKIPDAKNLAQRISDWKDDTYENIFRKFCTARGSRIYFTEFSHEIIKAIDKAGIKPTAGIDGLIEKHTDIESKLFAKSPTAKKHFAWFASTMEEVKKKMPKAYEKALRNGRSLRAVVSEVIRIAIRDSKVDEAKTALEILSVCKYGFITSKARENLDEYFKENKEGIFSNKDLSWNKNEGVKFVTGALDKTVRLGIRAAVQGVSTLNHIIQKNRTKFNGHKGVKIKGKWNLGKIIDANTAKMQEAKSRGTQIAQDRIDAIDADIKTNNNVLKQMASARVPGSTQNAYTKSGKDINETNIEQLRTTDLKQLEQERETKQKALSKVGYTEEVQKRINANASFAHEQANLQTAIAEMEKQYATLEAQINAVPDTPQGKAEVNYLYPEFKELEKEIESKKEALKTLEKNNADYHKINPATGLSQKDEDDALKKKFDSAQKAFNDANEAYNNLDSDIKEYDDKTQENAELEKGKKSQQDIINYWDRDHVDKYAELMSYWDTLESPSKVHSFRVATNKVREEMTEQEERDIGGDKKVKKTKAQWMAWQKLQGYKYAA